MSTPRMSMSSVPRRRSGAEDDFLNTGGMVSEADTRVKGEFRTRAPRRIPASTVQSNFYGKTRILRTRPHGVSHGPQPPPRRTSSRSLVPHFRQGAQARGGREGHLLRHAEG